MAQSNALIRYSGLFRRPLRPDNGHKWNSTDLNSAGTCRVKCKRCDSLLTIQVCKKINTYQRCNACNNIFSISYVAKLQQQQQSSLPKVSCPRCKVFNEMKLLQYWKCTDCKKSFHDGDRIIRNTSGGRKQIGFFGVQCIYCKSFNTKRNGKKIKTHQRCQACTNVFSVPAYLPQSNLPKISCPRCSASNKIQITQYWKCTECNKFFDG